MTTGTANDKATTLLELHAGPGFVLPNAWDAGSARILEQVGFPAIATTSAGIAWAQGVPDGGAMDRDTMLDHIGRIVAAVGVPVSADLEAGYGETAAEVGETVALAAAVGAVGANIEDARAGWDRPGWWVVCLTTGYGAFSGTRPASGALAAGAGRQPGGPNT